MVIMRHLLRVTFAIITTKCKQFPPTKVNANIFFYKHNPTLSKLNRFWLALNVCQNRNCLKWNEVNSLVLCCHIHPNMSVHEPNIQRWRMRKKRKKWEKNLAAGFTFMIIFILHLWFGFSSTKTKRKFISLGIWIEIRKCCDMKLIDLIKWNAKKKFLLFLNFNENENVFCLCQHIQVKM